MAEDGDIQKVIAQRRSAFKAGGVMALLRGQLPPGETFWIGNVAMALIYVPALVMAVIAGALVLPLMVYQAVLVALLGACTLFYVALTRAAVITGLNTPQAGGLRWLAVVLTACHAIAIGAVFVFAMSVVTAPG